MQREAWEILAALQDEPWNLFEFLELPIHVIDLDRYQIVYANKCSKNLLGEATGKKCWQVFHNSKQGPCSFCSKKQLFAEGNERQGTFVWEMQMTRTGRWYEMMEKAVSLIDGRPAKLQIAWDITERKEREAAQLQEKEKLEILLGKCSEQLQKTSTMLGRKEKELQKVSSQFKKQAVEFDTANIALKVMMDKFRQQENEFEQKVVSNIKYLIFPYMEILERHLVGREAAVYHRILKENLTKLSSSFSTKISAEIVGLTPREIQVADLIKEGRSTKEIAELLNLSVSTVECFRDHMRKKLGIKNKKVNLRSFLLSKFK